MTTVHYLCRPAQRAINATDEPYETIFLEWLKLQGYDCLREPDAFDIPPRTGHQELQHPTPDIKILALPNGQHFHDGPVRIYLELCQADRFITSQQLSPRTKRHNRLHGQSGRAYLPPVEYLRLKRRRMQQIERYHSGVIVEILDHTTQLACMADPILLIALIEQRLSTLSLPARVA